MPQRLIWVIGRGGGEWVDVCSQLCHTSLSPVQVPELWLSLCCANTFASHRYVELVKTDSIFEPHESFFTLFSDPRSTRLARIHLREHIVQDQDLEAIRKQVGLH